MFDGVVYLIFGIFTLIAFLRGFIKELLSIVSQIAAVCITYKLNEYATDILSQSVIQSRAIASVLAYIAIYIICLITFWIANALISIALTPIRLGFIDRFFGIILGLSKSYAICLIIYVTIIIAHPMLEDSSTDDLDKNNKKIITPNWLLSAKTYPMFKFAQELIDHTLSNTFKDGVIETIQQKIETGGIKSRNTKKLPLGNNLNLNFEKDTDSQKEKQQNKTIDDSDEKQNNKIITIID